MVSQARGASHAAAHSRARAKTAILARRSIAGTMGDPSSPGRSRYPWRRLLTLTLSLFDSAAVQAPLSTTWARNSNVFLTFFLSEKLP